MVPKCRVASVTRIHVRVEVNDFFTAADSAYNVANSVDIAFIVTELFHFFENEHSDVAFLIGIAARANCVSIKIDQVVFGLSRN